MSLVDKFSLKMYFIQAQNLFRDQGIQGSCPKSVWFSSQNWITLQCLMPFEIKYQNHRSDGLKPQQTF